MFKKIYYILRGIYALALGFWRAHRYFKQKELRALSLPADVELSTAEEKRIKHYFWGTSFLSIVFCTLRGYKRTPDEFTQYMNLAALTALFDDLVDEFRKKNGSNVQNDTLENYCSVADSRGLILYLLKNNTDKLPPQYYAEFRGYIDKIFHIEVEGQQSSDKNKTFEDIKNTTRNKGGFSVLLYRRIQSPDLNEAERTALFEFGYLVQLCDDILDVYFDIQDDVMTMPRFLLSEKRVDDLADLLEKQVEMTRLYLDKMPYRHSRIQVVYHILLLFVAIARLGIDNQRFLLEKYGDLRLASRRELVLDMALWRNRGRLLGKLLRG